ncbi:MAG TPA: hypothetical protein PKI14_15485 [Fervidobacterium sp.]|nr:hypothetical protein [Fervidobacterium sp.]
MIFEGSWWEQLFKAVGGVLVIIGFFSFIYKQKKGCWPWQKK